MLSSSQFPVDRRLVASSRRLLAALLFIATPAVAVAQNVITVRADSASRVIAPSSKFAVPVIIDMTAAGGTNLASLQTGVTFGTSRLTFDSVKTAGFGALTSNTTSATSGSLAFSVFDATGTTTSQTMATMYFTASATTGGTTIAFTPTVAGSDVGANILTLLRTRALDVCVAPSGKWGDVNGDSVATPLGDGTVNIIDAQQIARYSVSLSVANRPGIVARGDVTADGAVNIIDAQQIARFSVGLSAAARINTATFTLPAATTVAVLPASPSVLVGQTVQLTASVADAASASLTGCAIVAWASSDTTVAKVSTTGLVTGIASGSAVVTATSGSVSATVTVAVTGPTGTVATSLQMVQGDQQWSQINSLYGLRPQVRVLDAQSRPVPGVSVTFTAAGGSVRAPGSAAGVASVSALSDAWGIAQPGDWVAGTTTAMDGITVARGNGTLTASSAALTPVIFTGTVLYVETAASACALTTAGIPYCVGEYVTTNLYDRLSTDTTAGNFPVAVPGAVPLTSLAPAYNGEFMCGLSAGGQAYCWGWNNAGQLGDGTQTHSAGFRTVAGGQSFTKISSGALHTCAITSAGAAYCWGLGQYGQLGDGTVGQINTTPVAVAGGHSFVDIATNWYASCGVTASGQTWCWGRAAFIDSTGANTLTPKQLTTAPAFAKLALTGSVLCGITTGGSVSCAGSGSTLFGDGTMAATNRYAAFTTAAMPVSAREIYGVSHFCSVGTDGGIYCWGNNSGGQLGVGDKVARAVPTLVGFANPKRIQLHAYGTCYQAQNNQPYCAGQYAIGDGVAGLNNGIARVSPVPMKWVEGTAGAAASIEPSGGGGQSAIKGTAVAVAPSVQVKDYNGAPVSGAGVTFAVTSGGGSLTDATTTTNASGIATVGSWTLGATAGVNALTATVNGLPVVAFSAYGTLVPASLSIASGDAQVQFNQAEYAGQLAVLVKDAANAAASNVAVTFAIATGGGYILTSTGQVTTTVASTDATGLARVRVSAPYPAVTQTVTATVPGLPPVTFNLRSVGNWPSSYGDARCELTSVGAAFCWGINPQGQLGDGTTVSRSAPTAVSGGLVFASLADGMGNHACGLTSAGAAYCWGANAFGQLGDNTTTDRSSPTLVGGGIAFTKLALSVASTCGRTAAGALYCWGWTGYGIDGDGAMGVVRALPTLVSAGSLSFIDFSFSQGHICGVATTGAMYCWGTNTYGQVGDGTNASPRTVPTLVSGGYSFSKVSVGTQHTCGLTTAGAAYCWGWGLEGQRGTGATGTSFLPSAVAGGLSFTSLTAAGNSSCALTSAGLAYCWGQNQFAQVGDGTAGVNRLVPTPVLGGIMFSSLKVSWSSTCGRASAGNRQPFCWGQGTSGQLGNGSSSSSTVPTPVRWVEGTAGAAVSLVSNGPATFTSAAGQALATSPAVRAQDYANNPVSGTTVNWAVTAGGGSLPSTTSLTDVNGIASASVWTLGSAVGATNTITASATGLPTVVFSATATAAPASITIRSGDMQASPGNNSFLAPLQVQVKDAGNAPMAGMSVTFSVTSGGATIESGVSTVVTDANGFAQVRIRAGSTAGTVTVTAQAGGLAAVTFTARGVSGWQSARSFCSLTIGGAAYCWGANKFGQLGDGTTVDQSLPTAVLGGLSFTTVVSGDGHTCGLTAAGAAYCWGWNQFGELGDGTFTDRSQPVAVSGGIAFARLAAGGASTCGLTTAGALYCWGWSSYGLGGDGVLGSARTAPTLANTAGLSLSRVSLSLEHICGISAAGTLYCWGRNVNGALGDGTSTDRTVPTAVNGGRTYSDVSAHQGATCAIATGGAAFCWGYNFLGVVGDGTNTDRNVPTAVSGGLAFSSVTTANQTTCGVATGTGAAWCWGWGYYGKVGNGTTTNQTSPVAVAGGIAFTSVRMGETTTCANASNGLPYCWGWGAWGQSGTGSGANSYTPEPVRWVEGTAGNAVSMVVNGNVSFGAPAGLTLLNGPQVKVRDYAGTAVAGVAVTWTVTAGGGSLAGASSTTDASGIATAPAWTLGATVGVINSVTASAAGLPTPVFTATATAPPATLSIVSGNDQVVEQRLTFLAPLSVIVRDAANTPMAGMSVAFSVSAGGGYLSGVGATIVSVTTDGAGHASATLRTADNAGNWATLGAHSVTATVAGVPSVTFDTRIVDSPGEIARCELSGVGAAYCWGNNSRGQVGDGTTGTQRTVPTRVQGGLTFVSLADGNAVHACGLTSAGQAYCWGWNAFGQLGDGSIVDRAVPVAVQGGITFTQLAVSKSTTCGRTTSGALMCWGWTGPGLLGDSVQGVVRLTPAAVNTGGLIFTNVQLGAGFSGYARACAIATNGEVYCWGDGPHGQLGNGSFATRLSPVAINDGRTYSSITLGDFHVCGLTPSGAGYCWGAPWNGVLGIGPTGPDVGVPTAVSGGLRFASISASVANTCARTLGGQAYCWGYNGYGAVGDGTTTERDVPTAVLGGQSFSSLSIRYYTTCARVASGQPYCWGMNEGSFGDGSLAGRTSPTATSWMEGTVGVPVTLEINGGNNQNAPTGTAVVTPPSVIVKDYAGNPVNGGTVNWIVSTGGGSLAAATSLTNVSGIAAAPAWTLGPTAGATNTLTAIVGDAPSVVFSATSTVAASRLVLTTSTSSPPQGAIVNITAQLADASGNAVAISGKTVTWSKTGNGGAFAAATSSTNASGAATMTFATGPSVGTLYTVTATDNTALTGSSSAFTTVSFTRVEAGAYLSCGLAGAGAAYCWGQRAAGGFGGGASADSRSPVAVVGGRLFSSLAVAAFGACGLTSGGEAYCWGDDTGVNETSSGAVAGGIVFGSLTAGLNHYCGLASNGAAYCWGNNDNGQLGDGTTSFPSTPVAVIGGVTFSALAAGSAFTCGLTTGGAAYCWGSNVNGTLGDGTTNTRTFPSAVNGGLSFVGLEAGLYHVCARMSNSAAYCWGNNAPGAIGDGTMTNRLSPVSVIGGVGFSSLKAGENFSCGLNSTGAAYCWGSNFTGQIGVGTSGNFLLSPTAVQGGLTWRSISRGGWSHTCGVTTGGIAYCWGLNDYGGQLGDGTMTNRLTPTLIGIP